MASIRTSIPQHQLSTSVWWFGQVATQLPVSFTVTGITAVAASWASKLSVVGNRKVPGLKPCGTQVLRGLSFVGHVLGSHKKGGSLAGSERFGSHPIGFSATSLKGLLRSGVEERRASQGKPVFGVLGCWTSALQGLRN